MIFTKTKPTRLDAYYGEIQHIPELLTALEETQEMEVLRYRSHLSTPLELLPELSLSRADYYSKASKYAHSLGCAHLTILASQQLRLSKEELHTLVAALYLHDIGSPAGTHAVERRYEHHEKRAERLISTVYMPILQRFEIDSTLVASLILGVTQHPLQVLVHGTFDLDNAEGIPRFCRMLGLASYPYSGELVAQCYRRDPDGNLYLLAESLPHLRSWQRFRMTAFDFIWGLSNGPAQAMFTRAHYFANQERYLGELPFLLSDAAMLHHLSTECGREAAYLISQGRNRTTHFQPIIRLFRPCEELSIGDLDQDTLANYLADSVELPRCTVAALVVEEKACRPITLPIRTANGSLVTAPPPLLPNRNLIQVYLDPSQQRPHLVKELQRRTHAVLSNPEVLLLS